MSFLHLLVLLFIGMLARGAATGGMDCGIVITNANNARLLYKDQGCAQLADSAHRYYVNESCFYDFYKGDKCNDRSLWFTVQGPKKSDIAPQDYPNRYTCHEVEG